MDTKEIVWLTGISTGLCLLPTLAVAAETLPKTEVLNGQAEALSISGMQDEAPSSESGDEPIEELSEVHPGSLPEEISSSNTVPDNTSPSSEIISNTEPDLSATLPAHDPLEQFSTEEWLDLISEPNDKPAAEPAPLEQPALTEITTPTSNSSSSNPSTSRSSQSSSPISYTAADLMPAASEEVFTKPDPSIQPSLSWSKTDSLTSSSSNSLINNRVQSTTEASSILAQHGPQHWQTLNQNSLTVWGQGQAPAANSASQPDSTVSIAEASTNSMAQVTSVSQLSDVQPTDWAYQALQSLVERYGVIEGYPDGLFRGERALTRYEFAAGVNAAMDRLTQLAENNTGNSISKEDLADIQRLQDDFRDELITLRGRLDGLEARIAELSAGQFSTTVVLNGQVTFGLADAWGGDPPGLGETNPVFAYLAQLQLSGSFSERDAFRIDFDAGNFEGAGFAEPQALNTQMALMGFQTDTNNTLELSGVEYRFAVGDRLVFTLKPAGFSLNTVLSSNSIFSSVSQGALSRFAAETPIFKIGSLDAGVGLDWLVTDRLRLQLAYGARDASDPIQGLFKSDHRAFGVQFLARPFGAFTTGIAYVNAFADDGFLDTFTGSNNADTSGGFLEPSAIHAVSGTFQWPIVPSVVLGAWGGLAVTDSLSSDAVALSSTYQFSLGFPDTFGREGDLLGIMVGQPFRLRYGLLIEREDEGSGLHYEIFYRIRVNDNIAITPGVFVVTDPGHISDNDTIVVAALRTSFSF